MFGASAVELRGDGEEPEVAVGGFVLAACQLPAIFSGLILAAQASLGLRGNSRKSPRHGGRAIDRSRADGSHSLPTFNHDGLSREPWKLGAFYGY